ncbi:MAG: GNAT family N-acetyltransferase [Actinomycetota bacterium]
MTASGPDPTSLNTHVIRTPRLTIEPPSRTHALALYGMAGGPDRDRVTAGLLWDGPESVDDVLEWVEQRRTRPFSADGFGWVILDRLGEVSGIPENPLGSISLRPQHFPGRCSVGYWLGAGHWRKGVMTEALSALIDFAFHEIGVVKIEAEVFKRNTAGPALAEALGMRKEAEIRRAVLKRGEWLDELTYGLLPEEWSAHPDHQGSWSRRELAP